MAIDTSNPIYSTGVTPAAPTVAAATQPPMAAPAGYPVMQLPQTPAVVPPMAPPANDDEATPDLPVAGEAAKLPFGAQIAKAASQLGIPVKPDGAPQPMGWAKSLVGAAQTALADLGDSAGVRAPAGGGALSGITQTLANRSARVAGQKQLDFENNLKMQRAAQEKQAADDAHYKVLGLDPESRARIASYNAQTVRDATIMRDTDETHQTEMRKYADEIAAPLLTAGGRKMGDPMTTAQINDGIQKHTLQGGANGLDPSAYIAIPAGTVPMVDAKGQPVLDSQGVQRQEQLRQIITVPPTVTITPDIQKKVQDSLGFSPVLGPMPGVDYLNISARMQTVKNADLLNQEAQARIHESDSAVDRNRAETRAANLSVTEKAQNDRTKIDFAPYLAANNGDATLAMQQIAQMPDKKKAADLMGRVESLYGPGAIEKNRQDELKSLESTINDNSKVLNEHAQPGATPLPPDEDAELRAEIKEAQGKRNQYLGLHPDTLPPYANSVAAMDKVPADQRSSLILSSTMPNEAKVRLLQHYGLPVPATLAQPQAAAPAPAPAGLAGSIRTAVQQTDAGNRAQ